MRKFVQQVPDVLARAMNFSSIATSDACQFGALTTVMEITLRRCLLKQRLSLLHLTFRSRYSRVPVISYPVAQLRSERFHAT